jgi:SSS family solute:Na+ symporter
MPGIVAQQLYAGQLTKADQAYPILIRELIPDGVRGFIFAAVAGAVVSTLASVLNSASTIFTMDLYKRHLRPRSAERTLVTVGRIATFVFVAIGCLIAGSPILQGGVFRFIQEFQGYISPGILAAFAFGFAVPAAPPAAGVAALLLSAPVYGLLQWRLGSVAYLHRMLGTFVLLVIVMAVITALAPLRSPRPLPVRHDIDMSGSVAALVFGALVIAAVLAFFVLFR